MSTESATRTELEALGAVDEPVGQALLALAASIDFMRESRKGLMALPAAVKQLEGSLTALRERAPKARDGIDDLAARRDARRAV